MSIQIEKRGSISAEALAEFDEIFRAWQRVQVEHNRYQLPEESLKSHEALEELHDQAMAQPTMPDAAAFFKAYLDCYDQAQDIIREQLIPFCKKYGTQLLDLDNIDSHEVVSILGKDEITYTLNRQKTLTGESGILAAGRRIMKWFYSQDEHFDFCRDIRDSRRTLEWIHNLVIIEDTRFRLMSEPLMWVRSIISASVVQLDLEGPQRDGTFSYNGVGYGMPKGKITSLINLLWESNKHTVSHDALLGRVWGTYASDLEKKIGGLRARANRFFDKKKIPYEIQTCTRDRCLYVSLEKLGPKPTQTALGDS